ncbi:MAG: multidrug effflux MFS transporter [Bdellovibrionota bacterium]
MEKPSFNRKSTIFFLGVLNALTPFTIDLYLPAFAEIAQDLNTNVARVSLSVATYFIGYAIGQLLYGPLLDRFGRKKPIYFGLVLYLVATVGCLTARNIEALLFFRFLSALGGSAASVGAVAMVRDYFDPKEGARVFSYLMLVLSTSPLFAPTIGGWLAQYYGWRSVFTFLMIMATAVLVIVAFGLPKAFAGDKSVELSPKPLLKGFIEIFKVKVFRQYALAGALSFSGLFVYITGSPAIFIDGFGVTKQEYSYLFAFLAAAMIGGGQVNNQLMKKYSSEVIYRTMIFLQMMVAISFLIAVIFFKLNLFMTVTFIFGLLSCVGIAYPNAASLAMASFSNNAGRASALLGFIQMGVGAVLASMVGMMDVSGTFPTALVMGISAILAWVTLFIFSRHNGQTPRL